MLNPPFPRHPLRNLGIHESHSRWSEEYLLGPAVPSFPHTLLILELLVHDTCVDLATVSELILGDLGATLQILRLAGREFGSSEDRPRRIPECIASLGLEPCLEAASIARWPRDRHHIPVYECWNHSRQIAKYCGLLAGQIDEINPDEAYLVGLLHELGTLPDLLRWHQTQSDPGDDSLGGFILAKQWLLPEFIAESMLEHSSRHPARWANIVLAAHELARTGIRGDAFPLPTS